MPWGEALWKACLYSVSGYWALARSMAPKVKKDASKANRTWSGLLPPQQRISIETKGASLPRSTAALQEVTHPSHLFLHLSALFFLMLSRVIYPHVVHVLFSTKVLKVAAAYFFSFCFSSSSSSSLPLIFLPQQFITAVWQLSSLLSTSLICISRSAGSSLPCFGMPMRGNVTTPTDGNTGGSVCDWFDLVRSLTEDR